MGGRDLKSLLLVVGAGAVWSTTGPALKMGVMLGGDVVWIATSRTIFSALPALILRRFSNLFRTEIILFGVTLVSTFQLSYLTSVHLVGVSTAVILLYTSPAWVMLFSKMLLGEKITLYKTVCLILALTGVVFVSEVPTLGLKIDVLGISLGVLSGVLYGLITVYGKIMREKGIDPVDIALLTPAWAFAVMAPTALLITGNFNVGLWLLSPIYMGLASGSLAYYLFFKGVGGTEAGRAGIAALAEPALAVIWGVVFLGETFSPPKALGATLVFLAILITIIQTKYSPT